MKFPPINIDIKALLTDTLANNQRAMSALIYLIMNHFRLQKLTQRGLLKEDDIAYIMQTIHAETMKPDSSCNSNAISLQGYIAYLNDDYIEALKHLDRAVDLENALAINIRGFMHEDDKGGPINLPKAIEFLDKAVSLGNALAMVNRANMHRYGKGCPVNMEAGIKLLERACALDCGVALSVRGYMYSHGQGGPIDFQKAIKLFDRAIALGYGSAMNHRAHMHQHGQGGPIDYQEAIKLYDRAAALGNATAMNNRAKMHYYGQGGPVNFQEAIKLYERAILLGGKGEIAAAICDRAFMHEQGDGGPVDHGKAARLYRQTVLIAKNDSDLSKLSKEMLSKLLAKTYDLHAKYHIHMANKKPGVLPDKVISLFKSHPDDLTHFLLTDNLLNELEKKEVADFIGHYYLELAFKKMTKKKVPADIIITLLEKVPENSSFYSEALCMQLTMLYSALLENVIPVLEVLETLRVIDTLQQRILENDISRLEVQLNKAANELAIDGPKSANQDDLEKISSLIEILDSLFLSRDETKTIQQVFKFTTSLSEEEKHIHCIVSQREVINRYASMLCAFMNDIKEELGALIKQNNSPTDRLAWNQSSLNLSLAQKELKYLAKVVKTTDVIILATRVFSHLEDEKMLLSKFKIPLFKAALEHKIDGFYALHP